MRCYQCGAQLTDEEFCVKCGADVSVYKVVSKTSNSYYNLGLAKAQVRDLSGAVVALKTSLRLNKNNIKARNLLGLVYFEMGEVVEALSHWVISKNLKPEKNAASVYIKRVQSNQNKFEALNQIIKKYNMSLKYARENNTDLAIIQLKKVISMAPNYVKAQQLLALVYMKEKEYEKAKKCLRASLKIDVNNTISQRYMAEIAAYEEEREKDTTDSFLPKVKKKETENRPLSGNDVIIPRSSYKEPSNGAITVLTVLFGIVVGAALIWFLILPAKEQSLTQQYTKELNAYNEKLSVLNGDVTLYTQQIEKLTQERDAAVSQLETYTDDGGIEEIYMALILSASSYLSGDYTTAAESLVGLDVTALPSDAAKNVYSQVMAATQAQAVSDLYNVGYNYFRSGSYQDATGYFLRAFALDTSKVETVYYMAKSYENLGDTENAKKYYEYIVNNFTDSWYVSDARTYLNR